MASLSGQRCDFEGGKQSTVSAFPVKIWSSSLQRVSCQTRRNHQTSGTHAKRTYAYRVDANHMPKQARAELHHMKEHDIVQGGQCMQVYTELSSCSSGVQAARSQRWADAKSLPESTHSASYSEAVQQHAGMHGAQSFAELADSTAEAHSEHSQRQYVGVPPAAPPPPPRCHRSWSVFGLGAMFAIVLQFVASWLSVSPVWERFFGRFVWNRGEQEATSDQPPAFEANSESTALVLYSDSAESVEWVNMCWRKV